MEQLERSTESSEYLDAFLRLRTAKGWLMWLLLLALALNIGLCFTVRFTSLIERSAMFQTDLEELRSERVSTVSDLTPDDHSAKVIGSMQARGLGFAEPVPPEQTPPEAQDEPAATADQPETPSAETPTEPDAPAAEPEPAEQTVTPAGDMFYQAIHVALPMARVGGLLGATLLALVLLMSLKVVLLGRLKGVAYLTSSVLWSFVLLVLIIPWNQAFAGFPVPGVLFGARELIEGTAQIAWGAEGVGWEDHLLYWMRFVGYPILTLILWLTIQVQYARSYRPMVAGLQTEQS